MNRRPLIAYSVHMYPTGEGPITSIYSESYGLEMTIDSDWQVDTVVLCPPRFVSVMADLTSMGVKTGASYFPGNHNLERIASDQGMWLLCYPDDPLTDLSASNLNIIFHIDSAKELEKTLPYLPKEHDKLAIAYFTTGVDKPSTAQTKAAAIRRILTKNRLGDARILASGVFDLDRFRKFYAKPDIDGVFVHNANSHEMIHLIAESVGCKFE